MNMQVNSYVDFDAPINYVSIALNGLLKQDGALTDIKYHYLIDSKKEFSKNNDNEIKMLNAECFKYIKQMDIKLTELNYRQTRMYFSMDKNSCKGAVIAMSVIDILWATIMGICFGSLGGFPIPDIAVFFIAFIIAGAIFSFLPVIALKIYSDKNYMIRFNKSLLPRINSYIEIVKRNSKK